MTTSRRTLPVAGGCAAALVAIFTVVTAADPLGARTSIVVADIGELIASMVAAAACTLAAARHHGTGRLAWALFAASAFSWSAGEAIWSWLEIVMAQNPFPSIADIGYMASTPLALIAIFLFPGDTRAAGSRLTAILDGLIISAGVGVASWVLVLSAVYRASHEAPGAQALSLAYPVGDAIVTTTLILLIMRVSGPSRLTVGLLASGLGVIAVADSAFAYLSATNAYVSGTLLDSGWFAGYVLVALGALRASVKPAAARTHRAGSERWRPLLPYVPTGLALASAAREVLAGGALEGYVFWMMGGLFLLGGARQVVTQLDNCALLQRLQTNEVELRHRAFHDPLTDLPNRLMFDQRIAVALQAQAPCGRLDTAVLVIDIDNFKDINDTHGHHVGDEVLVAVARRLQSGIRPSDVAARLGGDEFGVLLIGGDGVKVDDVAARLCRVLREPIALASADVITVGASIGVAVCQAGEVDSDELLRRADTAMYAAKSRGKAQYVHFYPDMNGMRSDPAKFGVLEQRLAAPISR